MRELKTRLFKSAIAVTALASFGCQRVVNIPQGRVIETPLEVDEAMQIRDWDRLVAYYENPRFIAGPTGFWYETPYYPPKWYYAVTDSFLFLGQTAGLPVTLVAVPPWKMVEYAGETLEPTYHAMPPLPPASYEAEIAQEFQPLPPAPPEEPAMETPPQPQPPPAPEPPPPPAEPDIFPSTTFVPAPLPER